MRTQSRALQLLRYKGENEIIEKHVSAEFVDLNPPMWNETYENKVYLNTPAPNSYGIPISMAKSSASEREIIDAKTDSVFYLIFDTPLIDNYVQKQHKIMMFC